MEIPFLSGNSKETKEQIKAEQREKDFIREQKTKELSANDDQSYFYGQESKTDLLKWQQDLDDEVLDLIHYLLGYRKVNDSWQLLDDPSCNQKFVTKVVIPACKPFMARSLINSNWSEKMILMRLRLTADVISDAMADGFDEYDIDFVDYDSILNQLKTTITASAYRALNGWTKKIDSTMIKRIESLNEQTQQQQQKSSLWGALKT